MTTITSNPITITVAGQMAGPIKFIKVLVFENSSLSATLANGPFFASLASKWAFAKNYSFPCLPSRPNYIAMTSGNTWGLCGADAYTRLNVENIFDLVHKAGKSWRCTGESMPTPCSTVDNCGSGLYAIKHMPAPFYDNVLSNGCSTFCIPPGGVSGGLLLDHYPFGETSPPDYEFIAPNCTNDGHNAPGVSAASAWASQFIPKLIAGPWFANGVLFVTFDSDGSPPIYMVIVSPFAKKGYSSTNPYDHYGLLATCEKILGTGTCGQHDATAPTMDEFFTVAL